LGAAAGGVAGGVAFAVSAEDAADAIQYSAIYPGESETDGGAKKVASLAVAGVPDGVARAVDLGGGAAGAEVCERAGWAVESGGGDRGRYELFDAASGGAAYAATAGGLAGSGFIADRVARCNGGDFSQSAGVESREVAAGGVVSRGSLGAASADAKPPAAGGSCGVGG